MKRIPWECVEDVPRPIRWLCRLAWRITPRHKRPKLIGFWRKWVDMSLYESRWLFKYG